MGLRVWEDQDSKSSQRRVLERKKMQRELGKPLEDPSQVFNGELTVEECGNYSRLEKEAPERIRGYHTCSNQHDCETL